VLWAAKYLASNCDLVFVVGRVESGDDDRDADERLSGGVDVVSRHRHRCAAAASPHQAFIVTQRELTSTGQI